MSVTHEDILAARARIEDGIYQSPCPESIPLSRLTDMQIFCKLDYLQRTGSFKERGARNALLCISDEARARGVVAASAGNHALGLAYHGKLLKIPVTVVMPTFAPLIKVTTCKGLGARVLTEGETFRDAKAKADELAGAEGLTYIHGYDDAAIIAGQGTMGLEIAEQVANADAVVIPVGGGGLIAGAALAIKSVRPEIEVIGIEPEHAACFTAALEAGKPVQYVNQPTLADGLAVPQAGPRAFEVAKGRVDRVVTVTEDDLALAILRLVELEKAVVEGAGAAPLAGCLSGKLDDLKGRKVVLALCGGNIDPTILSRVIEKGLAADGRLCRFTAVISDRPGGLAALTRVIAEAGASVKEVVHDRAFSGPDVSAVNVLCIVETRDRAHVGELHQKLADANFPIKVHETN